MLILSRWTLCQSIARKRQMPVDLSKEYASMLFESQCVRKLVHWHGEPHVSALGNRSIDMGSLMSKTLEKLANHLTSDTIPRTSREILSTFGRRSTVVRSLRSYGLYGSTAVLQFGSAVERSMEEESKGSKVFGCSLCSHPLDARRVGGWREAGVGVCGGRAERFIWKKEMRLRRLGEEFEEGWWTQHGKANKARIHRRISMFIHVKEA